MAKKLDGAASALDYTKLSTWENMSEEEACLRLGEDSETGYYNPGAMRVSLDVFSQMQQAPTEWARFGVNCENLGLRNWKLFCAFKDYCKEDYAGLINCVLRADESMMRFIQAKEQERIDAQRRAANR